MLAMMTQNSIVSHAAIMGPNTLTSTTSRVKAAAALEMTER